MPRAVSVFRPDLRLGRGRGLGPGLGPGLGLVAVLALAAAGTPPAHADDEGSEHTASLVGAGDDTHGVVMHFDERTGWSLEHRARAGAATRRYLLPFLPADHAHYDVVVGPGRAPITFVLTSREEVTVDTPAIWVWSPTRFSGLGRVTSRWTLGDLFTADALARVPRSISHVWWQPSPVRLIAGRVLVDAGGRSYAIDPVRGTLGPP
jgi:hypothetical protein